MSAPKPSASQWVWSKSGTDRATSAGPARLQPVRDCRWQTPVVLLPQRACSGQESARGVMSAQTGALAIR